MSSIQAVTTNLANKVGGRVVTHEMFHLPTGIFLVIKLSNSPLTYDYKDLLNWLNGGQVELIVVFDEELTINSMYRHEFLQFIMDEGIPTTFVFDAMTDSPQMAIMQYNGNMMEVIDFEGFSL